MKNLEFITDPSSFRRTRTDTVIGVICLAIDDIRFPAFGWSDFVALILAAWCQELRRLMNGDSDHASLRFMEGPYVIELRIVSADRLHLLMIDAGKVRQKRGELEVQRGQFTDALLAAASQTILHGVQSGSLSPDILALRSAVQQLTAERISPGGDVEK